MLLYQSGNKNVLQKGAFIIEALIALAIITIVLVSVLGLAAFSLVSSGIAERATRAVLHGQETVESLRNYRDGIGWNDDDVANEYDGLGVVTTGVSYHLEQSVDSPPRWKLILGAATVDVFTKTVVFEDVLRDSVTKDIATSGDLDFDTKKAVITVSWQERGKTHDVGLVVYLTNWN